MSRTLQCSLREVMEQHSKEYCTDTDTRLLLNPSSNPASFSSNYCNPTLPPRSVSFYNPIHLHHLSFPLPHSPSPPSYHTPSSLPSHSLSSHLLLPLSHYFPLFSLRAASYNSLGLFSSAIDDYNLALSREELLFQLDERTSARRRRRMLGE